MTPTVTIGVCVRDCEAYVKEAIDSVLDQDFPKELMEVVFVDDGSEDKTLSIIHECVSQVDIPVRVYHTSWRGVGHARNIVVANAKSQFILWVDGDMVLSKDFVRKSVEFMQRHPKVGIAKGRQALVSGENFVATLEAYSRAASRMVDYQSEKGRLKALGTGGAIYRSEVMKQVGGFDENLKGYNEDWDIEIRARAAGWSFATIDANFLDYERRGLAWKSLWSRYWLRGYHTYYFLHKNPGMIKHYKMFPPAASISGLLQAFTLFKLTHQKAVFLLSFLSAFKMTAWYAGYVRSQMSSYVAAS